MTTPSFSMPTNPCPPKLDINDPEKLHKPVTVDINGNTATFTHRCNNVYGNEPSLRNFNAGMDEIRTKSPATFAAISEQRERGNVITFAVDGHPELKKAGGYWGKFETVEERLKHHNNNILVDVENKSRAAYTAHEFTHEIQSGLSDEAFSEIQKAWERGYEANRHRINKEEVAHIYGGQSLRSRLLAEVTWGMNGSDSKLFKDALREYQHEIGAVLMSVKIKYGQQAVDKYARELAEVIDKHIGLKIFTESNLNIALEKCRAIWEARLKQTILANENFKQQVQQKGLTDSYKSANPNNPIPNRPGTKGDIGGVACSTEYIEGLFDDPQAMFEKDHYFCMPALGDGKMPFTDAELKQILRELAIGIYAHSTVPFFSLHFNQNADLVPIIHPVYKNTLVGRVISMLDYIMKGYLNGGVFNEEFIDQWSKNPNWDPSSDSALKQMIDFTEHCATHLEGQDKKYISLRMALQGIKEMHNSSDEANILKNFSGFRNSFRIIAKQNSIQKEGNLFAIDSDFDVLYTINPSPEYKQALEEYVRKHGRNPHSYFHLKFHFL